MLFVRARTRAKRLNNVDGDDDDDVYQRSQKDELFFYFLGEQKFGIWNEEKSEINEMK